MEEDTEQPAEPKVKFAEEDDKEATPEMLSVESADVVAEGNEQSTSETPQDKGSGRPNAFVLSPGASLRRVSARSFYMKGDMKEERPDHFHNLVRNRRASVKYMDQIVDIEDSMAAPGSMTVLNSVQKMEIEQNTAFLKKFKELRDEMIVHFPKTRARMEVRIADFSYIAKVNPAGNQIKTVYNQSPIYKFRKWLQRCSSGQWEDPGTIAVLDNINLVLHPGKMYLVLGPPASGKTSLLKAVAGMLSKENGETVEGSVEYNGLMLKDNGVLFDGSILKAKQKDIHIENAISFVEQLDKHAPRLTVKETFDFAFQCRSGGTHAGAREVKDEAAREWVKKLDEEDTYVTLSMEALGLDHVANTFVGDNDVRGVSGGQRRRVTVGEMMMAPTPIFCGDEISTGLDAASTFDMVNILMQFTRVSKMTKLISLLQPSPETVSLFDEVILLAEGKIIFAGLLEEVENYFASLGYTAPEFMDLADFLQMLSTPDGAQLFNPPDDKRSTPYSMSELADAFQSSKFGTKISRDLKKPWRYRWASRRFSLGVEDVKAGSSTQIEMSSLEKKYMNSFGRSTWLNLKRALTIWLRDKRFLIANAVKNAIMGVSVGGVFYQTDDVISIYGVLFQAMLFIMLGAMVSAPGALDDRIIYYRHADANFYPAFPYVIGRAISALPQAITDVFLFGTILYWMVGLAATASNFFIFIAVLIVFAVVMNQMLNVFASIAATKSSVQALSAVVLLFSVLFGGFIVAPDVIPNYYSWIYWWNPMAWAYRALVLNEFRSSEYNYDVTIPNGATVTKADQILESTGFVHNGEPFGQEWVGYSFAYLCPYIILCVYLAGIGLILVRVAPAETGMDSESKDSGGDTPEEAEDFDLTFVPVTLTFEDICYDVQSSKGKETLRLLNNVNGYFASGRMCALMGSSGAGKTTLMDVIALRKSSGTITGDVKLNGFEQDSKSFRRCSGYVEQFDVQQPELTVRETVQFSARLRLDSSDPAVASDEAKDRYVDQVLQTLELTSLAKSVVGSDEEGGLSFEQKKRLSIAVELAASPSIIFLDEPTSGLDARAALIVVRSLRRIVDTGRTVIATIHQPSSAVFKMFDDLLLLKKGGRVVFFGELGEESQHLVDYFEALGADPIGRGENPANWMLKVIGGGISDEDGVDFAEEYLNSDEAAAALAKIYEINETPDPNMEIKYDSEFASPPGTRRRLMNRRLQTIYWRSPTYNLTRMLISAVIGFILGSIFLSNRRPSEFSETQMTSIFGVIFISFIITGVLSINSVLPVMLQIRDIFYRQQAAGMVDYKSLALALSVGEKWFILLSSLLFSIIFIPTSGISDKVSRSVAFWGFFTFNTAIYSYFGQCFMCCVRTMATAQILASVFIGLNNFFSGFIVRPQFLEGIFQFSSWITPGSYVFEGMIISLFDEDYRTVVANPGSDFYMSLGCNATVPEGECTGTVEEFVGVFFGGEYKFGGQYVAKNAIVLGAFLIISRMATFYALKYLTYTSS